MNGPRLPAALTLRRVPLGLPHGRCHGHGRLALGQLSRARPGCARLALVLCTLFAAPPALAFDLPALPAFKPPADVQRFDTSNLWQAINGAADLYLGFGFRQLTTADYDSKDVLLSVSVFEQATPLDAYGVFLKQRPREAQALSIGAAAIAFPPYQCVLVKGPLYVKADATRGKATPELCGKLLPVLAKAIAGGDELPAEFAMLPAQGQIPGSAGYTKSGYLGLSELRNAVHASYTRPGKPEHQVFVLLPDPGKTADAVVKALGPKWTAGPKGKLATVTRKIPYRGQVVISATPKGAFGVVGTEPADALAILEALAAPAPAPAAKPR
jgi:hypothetical protein